MAAQILRDSSPGRRSWPPEPVAKADYLARRRLPNPSIAPS